MPPQLELPLEKIVLSRSGKWKLPTKNYGVGIAELVLSLLKQKQAGRFALDTETTGLRPWHGDRPFSIGFCNPDGEAAFVRWSVDPRNRSVSWPSSEHRAIKGLLEDPHTEKIFHNHKFDVRMLEAIGIKVAGKIQDTMFAMHVLRTNEPTLGLKAIAKKYLGIEDDDEADLRESTLRGRRLAKKNGWAISTWGDRPWLADYWLADPALLKIYNLRDAERTMVLWILLEEKLKEEGLWKVYQQEMELAPITYKMESRGFCVHPAIVRREIKENKERMVGLHAKIQKAKKGLNVDSPAQLGKFIYGDLKIPVEERTEKGTPKVSGEVLLKIENPIVRAILDYKASEKAISNFFQRYLDLMVEEKPGVFILHPDFQQIGPVTGRYSCRNPNIQNVADGFTTRSSIPIQARTPFGPRDGYRWYHFDYSQIEMWIFASLAKETKMLEALFAGRDLHGETAEHIWGKGVVAKEAALGKKTARGKAKMMNFGIVYGIGPTSLARLTKTTIEEAKRDLDAYKNTFKNIDTYMEKTIRFARNNGFVQGPMGRRWQVDSDRAYTAVNYVVQGSAAQVIKDAMVMVDRYFQAKKLDAHLVATIHDEHIDEIRIGVDTPALLKKIRTLTEDYGKPFDLPKLPVKIEMTETSWSSKKKVEI